MITKVDQRDIEQFLYREAELLDSGKLDEWLALFTDEARYWVPCNSDDYDPNRHVSIIYDDRKRMEERVWRLQSGLAHAQLPPSRTRHLITNVVIREQNEDRINVSSNFLLVELRRSVQTVYSGRLEHHLKNEDLGWKISFKKVELLNNNEALGNLSFIF